ncbi:fluoride efflux transporter CrcB [Halobacillus sp. A5]|uniref:fluoride efflux transporter CrcB n=1 Tax=Halobacillus sp. A5 TaxID=2880263 RepID=UPI0020A68CAE|nr:fluoride efflux transporter CrcB [Halobacillus sp. A5]MCP3027199.1 fluoride efflux transporter CrcB [Halobacillus sp. A5]
MSLISIVLVGVGGFIGAVLRFAVSEHVKQNYSFKLPAATLFVNLSGSFLLGLLTALETAEPISLLFGVGMLGAFTTFSTFKLEGIQLRVDKERKQFLLYNVISYGGGIFLAFIGIILGRLL